MGEFDRNLIPRPLLAAAAGLFLLVIALAAALAWKTYWRRSGGAGERTVKVGSAPLTTPSLSPAPSGVAEEAPVPTLSAGDSLEEINKDINASSIGNASSELDRLSTQADSL